ncbi:hypothetical protein BS47DRAFT_1354788 [Hydnum rufescens UP504]|uniref:Uncharacterized protein n=1 Tax=Hydnum rufescens UP504 TaxID=1448309 RepID=A0A9P6DJS4_9AGAM|nr:hypothetical protein BS47DRAFT_1354788 [Hydnum rufescens UP504]
MQGIVTFRTTKETLHEGLRDRDYATVRVPEDTLSVTRFARQIKDICAWNRSPRVLYTLVMDLKRTYEGDPEVRKH